MKLEHTSLMSPLPRRFGLTFITNEWGMNRRHGHNQLNTVQPQQPGFKDKYGGFRLVRDGDNTP